MNWDQNYQNEDTPWDHGEAAPAIAEVIERERFCSDSKVLVPGCGLGHDVRAWADAGFQATGLDVSGVALKKAKELYDHRNTKWLCADFFDPDQIEQGGYDIVWEHTCFCAIPLDMRKSYVEAVFRGLRPGGIFCGLFFIDTGNPAGMGPPFKVSPKEVVELFGSSFDLRWEKLPDRSYHSRVGKEWLMTWEKR